MNLSSTHGTVNTPTFLHSRLHSHHHLARPIPAATVRAQHFHLNRWQFSSSVKQPLLLPSRRRPARRQRPGLVGFGFVPQVIEDLLDHHRGFYAGNHLHRPTACTTGLDIDVEDTLQARRPSHG